MRRHTSKNIVKLRARARLHRNSDGSLPDLLDLGRGWKTHMGCNKGGCTICHPEKRPKRVKTMAEAKADLAVPEYWADRLSQPLFLDEMAGFGSCYSYGPEARAALLSLFTKP